MSENTSISPYSPIVGWEVENFMSIEKGRVEFDDTNIINFKGYNDSGKSAMLTALKVATTNSNASKQVSFIQDDKEYFRVVIYFADGVRILRDKYINGQSLYEMYKNDDLLYTSKSSSGALTKISEVPKPIADYLGLIMTDGSVLNARSCFEKQLGVQTTGSENYKMFNTILKSEELSRASELLNNDKNKVLSNINSCESQLNAKKELIKDFEGLTIEMITALKDSDKKVDDFDARLTVTAQAEGIRDELMLMTIPPEVDTKVTDELSVLCSIGSLNTDIKAITVPPETKGIDIEQISALDTIQSTIAELKTIEVCPSCGEVNIEQLSLIQSIKDITVQIKELTDSITATDAELNSKNSQLEDLNKQMEELGAKMVKCPHCGMLFSPDDSSGHNY